MLRFQSFLNARRPGDIPDLCCVLLLFAAFSFVSAANADGEEVVDFNRDIRPLLSANCFACHGPDEEERAAGLRLDTQRGSREDLGGYAAIVPKDPDSSELLVRLIEEDEDLRMPPEGKGHRLNADEVDLVRRWISQGASYAQHWAYIPPERPQLPEVENADWIHNPIDRFILARLDREGLRPSPRANRLTLARRVALDLTGLPPTWEEAVEFRDDENPDAYQRYVDRQMDKPAFGERWARVWLDLARYADSAGYADDPPRKIWAYRDYVIRSLNENKPFDQFTIEQIAGDLLPSPTDEQLIATAFHRNTLTNNEGGTNDEEFRNVAVVDRVNTTMAVWMGTTMACAQCHTHKFDPITQDEYFQFFAFFNNTKDADIRDERPFLEIWSDAQESLKRSLTEQIASLERKLTESTPRIEAAQAEWLRSLQQEPQWRPLVPRSADAENRELAIAADGTIEALGEEAENDRYELRFPTSPMTLSALKLDVLAEQKENFVLSEVTAKWIPKRSRPVDARFVRVELPGEKKMIHLAEIQVFSSDANVALEGAASQSSTGFGGKVDFINDGKTDGDFKKGSVTHTLIESDPWIEIDLGGSKPIDRIEIWNRTDGGDSIVERLKGYRVVLLDEERQRVWAQSPKDAPRLNASFKLDGVVEIDFVAALADHSQSGFPAESVLAPSGKAGKPNAKKNGRNDQGWAVSPQQGKPHDLTLVLGEPLEIGDGELIVHLNQQSQHKQHLLDRFRIAFTSDPGVAQWAEIPANIREVVTRPADQWTESKRSQVAKFYRSIAPLLKPDRQALEELKSRLKEMKPSTTVPIMQAVAEADRRSTKVQIRGSYLNTGTEVSEGVPAAFHPLRESAKPDRLDLATWLIDSQNPLTARVIANRHWEEIFGSGIVQTSEEFGSQGELPSHPQLLDWMAVEFMESGWDLKHLLRLLVTSATYQQSSFVRGEEHVSDPFNRLYARGPRFRVSAEMVRDQVLFVSGLLSEKMYGPPVKPPQPESGLKAAFGSQTDWKTSKGGDRYRRGLYTTWRRSSPYPSMAQFDAPNREVCTVRRIRTNTPLQALVTLNDPVYVEAAQSLARKMIASGESPQQRIQFAFRTCLLREPKVAEIERLSQLASTTLEIYQLDQDEAKRLATDPLGDLPDGMDAAEAAAWTVVGNVILNLDEMFMKR